MIKRRAGRVLCISDDPVNLNLRGALLQRHGWIVLTAGGGHQGIFRFSQEKVDVVVVDLNHDGSESALVIAELKRLKPEVPVVLLVSQDQALAANATQQATLVVVKRPDRSALLKALRSLFPGSSK